MKILYLNSKGGLHSQPKWYQNFINSLYDRYGFVDLYMITGELNQIGGLRKSGYIQFNNDEDAVVFLLRWS